MRNVPAIGTPNLFSGDPGLVPPLPAIESREREEQSTDKLAREFVRWCCSFGSDFRNSPDVTNLRYWLNKSKIKTAGIDEGAVLIDARRLLLKKVEQGIAKSASPAPGPSGPLLSETEGQGPGNQS